MSDSEDRYEEWCVDVVERIGFFMGQRKRRFTEDNAPQHGETCSEYLERQAGDEPIDAFESDDTPDGYAMHFVHEADLYGHTEEIK